MGIRAHEGAGWTSATRMTTLVMASVVLCTACSSKSDTPGDTTATATTSSEERPDVLPVMLNKDLPFRYPPALYAEKTQGNVTLRLFIDSTGKVVTDSTHVAESSKVPTLDSAAMRGARELRFQPAKSDGKAIAVSILFPVYFRHPEAPPPAEDTVLKKIAPAPPTSTKPPVGTAKKP